MKKKFSFFIEYGAYSLIAAYYLFGCQKKESVTTSPLKPEVNIGGTFRNTDNFSIIHLYSDTVYVLQTDITVNQGQELVIDEGTLIKSRSSGISVQPGGIIRANGSRNKPVIFTSDASTGTAANNWGGLSITGKAKNNNNGNSGDSTDNSGALTFVRIEFAPLTLTAVGSKTVVENVMVSYANRFGGSLPEPSFKFFGGSFNAKNLISYACGGPADFFITNGYNGKMQNILAYRNAIFGAPGDAVPNSLCGVFISNSQYGTLAALPVTNPSISNLTVLGPGELITAAASYKSAGIRSAAVLFDYNAVLQLRNSLLTGFPLGGIFVNDAASAANIELKNTQISTTYFHANDSSRTFYLEPGVYPPANSYSLAALLLEPGLKNVKFITTPGGLSKFGFEDPFNYNNPNVLPIAGSPVLKGADFSGNIFGDPWFAKVENIGALGADNWLTGWTNFLPLKTNYNYPDYKPF